LPGCKPQFGASPVILAKLPRRDEPNLNWRPNRTIDELMESGTVVVGSPRAVRTRIERMREATGLDIVVAMLQFGVLTNELTKRNVELFASEVMLRLRG
jgi:alkanesulfonate monooxygenase SsuD/methylene tetrahydromethanopterin reductase-like flavin-dependent oxidoreductase (luciferase family)